MENRKQFKPFDKVLVRDGNNRWKIDFYSHFDNECNGHHTMCYSLYKVPHNEILPYEGNEHLLGTTDKPEEKIKLEEEEFLVCFDCMDYFDAKDFCLSPFDCLSLSTVRTKDGNNWGLFIRLSDFNPEDMEETKKHILCVKNGKIIRYKG